MEYSKNNLTVKDFDLCKESQNKKKGLLTSCAAHSKYQGLGILKEIVECIRKLY